MHKTLSIDMFAKSQNRHLRLDIFLLVLLVHAFLLGLLLQAPPGFTPPKVLHASWLGNSGTNSFGAGSLAEQNEEREWTPREKPLQRVQKQKTVHKQTPEAQRAAIAQTTSPVLSNSESRDAWRVAAEKEAQVVSAMASLDDASGGQGQAAAHSGRGTAYLYNPDPDYPQASIDTGEEGRVMLRVYISSQGIPEEIKIYRSSGFPRLDSAAKLGVERWRFRPAHQGNTPVAMWVIIPVKFSLKSS